MPHLGHLPGCVSLISGCMGHVHTIGGVLSALMKAAGSASNFFWQCALQNK